MICRALIAALTAAMLLPASLVAQAAPAGSTPPADAAAPQDPSPARADQPDSEDKRIFWIIPNYRTSPTLKDYKPLTAKEKFRMAAQDASDLGTFELAALFAGYGQWRNQTPSFGHGVAGYARYYTASASDLVIGDFMTEAIFPAALRQDPRYFRQGTGSRWSRLGYAAGQIFWTHTDSGGTSFNYSEIVGNATAVAIGDAYYPDNRNLSSNASKLGIQVGVDMASNILKEFWPDLDRAFARMHHQKAHQDQ
jgi:hypothetical protein